MKAAATRRTKIVVTLGPALKGAERLREALEAGADVVRINLSHTTLEELRAWLEEVDRLEGALQRAVGVMLDTKGPEVRLTGVPSPGIALKPGAAFVLGEPGGPSVDWPGWTQWLKVGSALEFGDGEAVAEVVAVDPPAVRLEVTQGGQLAPGKKVSPGQGTWPLPPLSPFDCAALEAAGGRVDFVAVSFVRSPEDLRQVRQWLAARGFTPQLVAKMETRRAVEQLDAILAEADAVMVARGDLGVECSPVEVPELQKQIIFAASGRGVPVITATQMLESMVEHPVPTRAEATDVANAIWDGSDAVMLSEETAVGRYPIEAIRTLAELAARADQAAQYRHRIPLRPQSVAEAVAWAACAIADTLGVDAILTPTESGATARSVSRYRPAPPVAGLSPHRHVLRRLTLWWGITPIPMEPAHSSDDMMKAAVTAAVRRGMVAEGDRYILTAGVPFGTPGSTNLLRIESVSAPMPTPDAP